MARLIFVFLMGLVLVQPLPAFAQKLDSFAVINIQKVLRLSLATKAIKPQVERLRENFQNQIREREKVLKTENETLERERAILSPEAYQLKRRTFRSKVTALQSDVESLRRRLDRAGRTAMTTVNNQFRSIAAEIARERKLQVIIPRSTAIHVDPAFDITDEVLKRLDQRLPTVAVTLPPPANVTQPPAKK